VSRDNVAPQAVKIEEFLTILTLLVFAKHLAIYDFNQVIDSLGILLGGLIKSLSDELLLAILPLMQVPMACDPRQGFDSVAQALFFLDWFTEVTDTALCDLSSQ
jgi:hypothetical protein